MDPLLKSKEEELEEWESTLIEQQSELTGAMRAFRDAMQEEAAQVQAMAAKVSKRERAVKIREMKLLELQEQLKQSVAKYKETVRQSVDTLGHRKEVKAYEGKVDGAKGASYVENLSDSEEDEKDGGRSPHRGLRGSPQHVPLNAENDNMFFRRKSSLVDLKGRDKPMQQKFDDAVEILLTRYEPEAIIALMEQGLSAKDVIAMAENVAGDDMDDDGYDSLEERPEGAEFQDQSGNPIPYMDDTREDYGDEEDGEDEEYDAGDPDIDTGYAHPATGQSGNGGVGQMRPAMYGDFDDESSSDEEDDF